MHSAKKEEKQQPLVIVSFHRKLEIYFNGLNTFHKFSSFKGAHIQS